MRPVRTVIAIMFAAAIAVTGCTAHSAVQPATPSPSTTASPTSNPPQPAPSSPTTTLPLGRIQRLDAVQAVGSRTVWAVGKGTILTTSNGGRTWARVWRGAQELDQVDFVNTSTGWALGGGVLVGTVDGGQHWRQLGQPRHGPLRRIHFSSPTQGWGVAGGPGQPSQGPQAAATLVHTSDGGRTWSVLAAPTPPQSVCFTAASDGWLASGTSVWRSSTAATTGARDPASPCRHPPPGCPPSPSSSAPGRAPPGSASTPATPPPATSPMRCTPPATVAPTGAASSASLAPWARGWACRPGPATPPAHSR